MRFPIRLYLVTDRHLCGRTGLLACLEAALWGGVDAVQLREKDLSGASLWRLAADALALCRRRGVPLLVNDRIDVALAIGADGVHLPSRSFPVAEARRLMGPHRLVGVSTHSPAEVAAAHRAGADFAVFGPVFATPAKLPLGLPVGLCGLQRASAAAPLPILAIGGIDAERVESVLAAGASGVACIAAILSAADPGTAARRLRARADLHCASANRGLISRNK